uniref:Uncharacterized protein n=2 Tax=Anopheles gambiae TaxID=7165 RepID=A0A453Z051_ANOGA
MIPGVGGVPRARLLALLLLALVEVIARALGDPAPYIAGSSSSSGTFLDAVVGGGAVSTTSNDVTAEPVRHQRSATGRAAQPPPYSFHFAHAVYNVSIPENSVIKTYAVQPPNEPRMGLHVTPDLEVRYKIVAGDKDRFFKAEERAVGDFVFLAIRLRTNNIVLNREKGDSYRLEVKATGTRREGKSRTTLEADTTIDVRVLDANDLSPLFYPTEYAVAITEDTPLHKSILHVVAEDADLGLNGEIYYSILDETEQFAVHPTTGVITLTRPLRFAERALHELTVVANDRGIGSTSRNQASKARVKIKVLQVNLFAPDIYVQALPDILENSNTNIFGIVRVTDKDKGVHGQIKSLDIVDGDPDGHFRIKPTDRPGEYVIEVHRLLDRETAPAGYNLTLRAVDRGVPPKQSYLVTPVRLADINDNAPVFNREIYEVSVPETSPPNTPVIRLKVTDRDEGKNAKVFLEIVGGNEGGEFRVNPETGMLYTAVPLDAELKAFYTLTVSAIDQGNPGTRKQSSAKVKINVQDTNDNDPIFETANLTIYVDENEPAGTSVTKVTARDKDLGENAYISYSIANLNDVPFDIDHFSGTVRTSKLLDYESMRREYVLRVRASDWGLPYRRQTEMQLVIKLRDVNDNRPQFERIDCLGRIPRYTPIGTEIFTLSALDFDYGSVVTYRLLSGFEDGCFNLDSVTGIISVGCDLNDVGVEQRELNVTATDGTHFADTARIQISLVRNRRNLGANLKAEDGATFECRETGVAQRLTEIMAAAERNNMPGREAGASGGAADDFAMMPSRYGENVHAPEFVDLPLEVKINESVPLGTTITWIKARDRDLGYNGKLVFGISGGDDDSVFRLDPDNGELKIIGYLDRERQDEYLLNITVYDLGKPQKSISKILPLTILDENDNVPKFEKSLASFRVTENAINGTIIFRVKATDADLGQNAKITYSLVTDTKDFRVDPETGVLTVVAPLDRERQEVYELKIRATDGGGDQNTPALYSDALVRVTVDDINDNAPEFAVQDLTVRIREDVPRGTVVTVVSAIDLDSGTSSEIVYSFGENGDGEGSFRIDKQSGTIRTARMLDFEERQVHSLIVKAIDRGTPSLSSETSVIVEVIDVNENRFAPQFEDYVLTGAIAENKPPGAQVMQVLAKDADLPGPDSRVTYSIKGGDGLGIFTIDNEGTIRTLASLDLETKPNYWLTVCAQDQAVVPLHSCVQVYIEVQNENDNVPLTEDAVYYPSVPESSPPNVKVLQLAAEDRDIDPLQQISYRIISGNPEGNFAINSTSGLITTTARKLDRENQPEHILEVLVMDNGEPQLSSTTRVVVQVEDVNDHAPEFDQKMYKVQIPANAKIDQPLFQNDYASSGYEPPELELTEPMLSDPDVGLDDAATWESFPEKNFNDLQVIFRVLATDQDIGENGRVTYSIKPGRGKAKKFRIDPDTGVIYAARTFEIDTEYDLLVRAEDHGVPKRSQQARVVVAVVGVPLESENAPVVKTGDQHVEVTESDAPGYLVTLIQASDADGEQVWYDIVGGDERHEFYIGRDNGNVLLAKYLDWERQPPDSTNGPCAIYVVDELDYERRQTYELLIRATDSVSGVSAEVPVSVLVQDVNDCPPEIEQDSYNITVSERAPFGTAILKVQAKDNDTGINQVINYALQTDSKNTSEHFHMDPADGVIYLKKSLDHETLSHHHFTVVASDKGVPSLSSTAHVWVSVMDMNDNPPKFEQPSYSCVLSEHASRGQFVTVVSASDPDYIDHDRLVYTIAQGNELQTYGIDPVSGIITLVNMQNFAEKHVSILNVSVTDGVYTSFTRVKITILPANLHNPVFEHMFYDAKVDENQLAGRLVTTVKATDKDFGEYGRLAYSIISDDMQEYFSIDKEKGEIVTKKKLDREERMQYDIPVMAVDAGGRAGFSTVRLRVGDENDNQPVFQYREYKTLIQGNLTVNTTFYRVRAVDADDNQNAVVKYSIFDSQNSGIRELFGVDENTGGLYLQKSAVQWENQLFQFFIRAHDGGTPSLYSDVPIDIYVMSSAENPPLFEKKDRKLFLSESSLPGTVITRLKLSGNVTARYRILSDELEEPQFTINDAGQLRLAKTLDREVRDAHLIAILAETDSSPPLTAVTEIVLHVQDENDNTPIFESNPYSFALAENIEKGSSIMKLTARDADSGSNGDIRYALSPDVGDIVNIFDVDAYTGWITTLVALDKEKREDYKFQVLATDNGQPKHTTRSTVIVRLKDYNDCPPVFREGQYKASVSEDALPGTVVLQIATTDKDVELRTAVEYYIIAGDSLSQFQIKNSGEVFVVKALDRESIAEYELKVIVTDGKYTATANISITVLDANDNPPYCLKYRYREQLSEGARPGTHVLQVLANDMDEPANSRLRFYLTGNGAEDFNLDKDTGHLKTARKLDRETQSRYSLMAHVQDRDHPGWECSSQIELALTDLNDNAPEFSMNPYSVTLPEDAEVGTLVTKIHATDADIGINRKIKYAFLDSYRDHFRIAPESGIVTLAKPLDREQKALYNLSVSATDLGHPALSNAATLVVNVQDINDNPPEFTSKHYFASVPEINAIGSEILKVLATSKDTGINAEITYSIIGGNEHRKFGIHNRTGVLSLADTLDYERAKDYFLTIQAVDGGTPPLSNLATVNISVTDSNDNHPQFTQNSYSARIREDAQRGDRILQVRANDLDAEENGRVSYTIERGDRMEQFAIEEDTGYVAVAGTLDRESISNYVLEVQARDHGVPTLTAYVLVNIEISDANDNPPVFTQQNYTAVVQEDKQIGHTLLKFDVTDADAAPNAAPYTFDFRSGNEGGAFRIEQDGILRTATRFNSKIRDSYQLQVRVFDNGTPPLYSDTWVLVKVIEESQYPPVITPLDIAINSFLDEYPGGVIGKVYATDQDQYDTLTYGLAPTVGVLYSPTNLFNISRNDGVIYAYPRLDVGDYRVNVTVTDGKFAAYTIVKVSVELINEEMLANAIVIRFLKVSPEAFVLSHRKGFIRSVRNAIGCKIKDIIIISVQPSNDDDLNLIQHRARRELSNGTVRARRNANRDLDVLFTVRNGQTGGFYAGHEIRRVIDENLEEIEDATKLQIDEVVKSKCLPNYCIHGECEDRIVLDAKLIHPVSTDVTSFVSARHAHRMECACREGYGGDKCQHAVNECSKAPCPPYKTCIPDSSDQGYHCTCREGFAGPKCDRDITLCHDETCYVPRNPVSFSGKSYAHYRIEKEIARKNLEDQLVLGLRLRTVQPTGNIMYSAGKVDFNVLEIMNGMIQYRFDLGSGEGLVSVSSIFVSDGLWHEVRLEREGNSAKLFVDGKHVAQGNAPGVNGVLNLQSDDIFFGAEVKQHPTVLGFQDVQRGFVGCMDDIRLSKIPVPLHMKGASSVASLRQFANVEFSCDAASVLVPLGVCGTQPCWNGGTCKDIGGGNFECLCHSRFKGPYCKEDQNPCASSPCLYGGKCSKVGFGNYTCDCPARMSGKRCDYGRFCTPNPCRNGGVCEEGDDGPLCMCHGYSGTFCETDIDECERQPCGSGATCINEAGSFRCICPPEMTGASCGDPLSSNALTIAFKKVSSDLFFLAVGIVGLALVSVVVWGVTCACRKKRRSSRHEKINNEANKGIVLNPVSEASGYKRGSKMSNLEIQRDQRPVSYTPSSNNAADHLYNCNAMLQYNNLDTLRSYGSAGDELENVPPEYRKGTVPCTQQMVVNLNSGGGGGGGNANTSDTESLHKQKWTEQIQLQTFTDKINNDLKRRGQGGSPDPLLQQQQQQQHQQQQPPHPSTTHLRVSPMQLKPAQMGILPGRLLNTQHSPTMLMPPHSFEDGPAHHGSTAAYHWDCSDWVGRGHHPLPNITEVPGSEVPDSSSFHSNESNESHPKASLLPPILGPVDSTRDIETLNEDNESEYVDDSECDQSEQPLSLGFEQNSSISCLNPLDSGSEDYRFNTADSYLRHPNSYLPKYNIQSETEGENVPLTGRKPLNGLEIGRHQLVESDDDDVESYGFPQTRRNRREPSDIDLVLKTDEGSSLLSHSRTLNSSNHSNSDLSTQLCEIDDSEYEESHHQQQQQQQHPPHLHPHHHHHHQHHHHQLPPPQANVSSGGSSGGGSVASTSAGSTGATAKPKQQKVKWSNVVQQTEV